MSDYKFKCLKCGTKHEYTKEEAYKLYDQDDIICPICGSNQMLMIEYPKVEDKNQDEIDNDVFEAYDNLEE